jgi:hypothetical protein
MSDMTQPCIYVYGLSDAPDAPTTFTPATDGDVAGLAMAVDASIDAIGDALAMGDMGQASALQTAADATSDALLSALGLPDADDPSAGAGY